MNIDGVSCEFLDKVKHAFRAHFQEKPLVDASESRVARAIAIAKSAGKLSDERIIEPGIRVELSLLALNQLPRFTSGDHEDLRTNHKALHSVGLGEEAREAAWIATAQHGFAALADIPELQSLLSRICMHAVDFAQKQVEVEMQIPRPEFLRRKLQMDTSNLMDLLLPPLRVCLLAEVAAGLIVPGVPLPPDTPEHGAALHSMFELAGHCLQKELEADTWQGDSAELLQEHFVEVLSAHAKMQLHPAGHELLDKVCQLTDQKQGSSDQTAESGANSSSSSSRRCSSSLSSSNSRGLTAELQVPAKHGGSSSDNNSCSSILYSSITSDSQLEALRKLLWQWQPVLNMAQKLRQQLQPAAASDACQGSNSHGTECSSPMVALIHNCSLTSMEVLKSHGVQGERNADITDASADTLWDVPASLLSAANQALSVLEDSRQQCGRGVSQAEAAQLPAAVVSSQLHVLCGALVMQFVHDARAAGGAAWHQEVPLQTVVLLGVLEQVQGMMAAAAVRQKEVADAASHAAAKCIADERQLQLQSTAADQQYTAADSSRPHQVNTPHHFSLDAEQQPQQGRLLHKQQQCSHEQHCQQHCCCPNQQECRHLSNSHSSEGLILIIQKVLELVQLIRKFKELNAALNCKPAACSSAAGGSGSNTDSAVQHTEDEEAVCSLDDLVSVTGPIWSLYPEPCTVNAWGLPASATTTSTAEGADAAHTAVTDFEINPGRTAGMSAASSNVHTSTSCPNATAEVQQYYSQKELQVMRSARSEAFAAALLLFNAQDKAHKVIHSNGSITATLQPWDPSSSSGNAAALVDIEASQLHKLLSVAEYLQAYARQELRLTLAQSDIAAALMYGFDVLQQSKAAWKKHLQQQKIDPAWVTIHQVKAPLLHTSSSSSSEIDSGDLIMDGDDAVAAGQIQSGALAARQALEMNEMKQCAPVLRFLRHWWQQRRQLHKQSVHWWVKISQTQDQSSEEQQQKRQQQQRLNIVCGNDGSTGQQQQEADDVGSSSSSDCRWDASPTACPLCLQERHKQQQPTSRQAANRTAAAGNGSSGHAHSSDSQQKLWLDPFMWRRIIWGLLGRLKPSAQAWYVQHYGMCHHCPNKRLWAVVLSSVLEHLWWPVDADVAAKRLANHNTLRPNTGRAQKLIQYARALNTAYKQNHDAYPAAPLLSQLVLLSLSPTHQQLLPPCEVAPLCPSSFGPGINQMLSHQFGVGPLLQPCLGKHGQVRMWHVWWHIGIRRYHWIKQHQEQPDQHKAETSDRQGGSCSNDLARSEELQQQGLAPLTDVTLDQLYSDPAARYYAAGFASKQLAPYGVGLRARAALQAPHLNKWYTLNKQLSFGRMSLLQSCAPADQRQQLYAWHALVGELNQLEQRSFKDQDWMQLFPPVFRPEGQVGAVESHTAFSELDYEAELGPTTKPGEALHILTSRQLLSKHSAEWLLRIDALEQLCDVCHTVLADHCVTCMTCHVPCYCSSQCEAQDAAEHATLCRHLVAATQRYAPDSNISNGSSSRLSSCKQPLGHHWRVLDLLQPEPGPLGTDCGALS